MKKLDKKIEEIIYPTKQDSCAHCGQGSTVKAIKQLIKEVVDEVIGEDMKIKQVGVGTLEESVTVDGYVKFVENKLRQQQRDKLNKLLK